VGDRPAAAITRSRSALVGLALTCLTISWFGFLGTRSLYDPDEGRYAEIPREMLQNGDWILPHLNGLVYLEKPPLQYWLTALSFRCFGESEGAARLMTGLAGYLTLVVVFMLGRRLWGTEAGVKAVALTAASTLFVLLGHQLTLDMLLSFLLTSSLACFLLAQSERENRHRSRWWMLGCWVAMALGVLAKGPVAVLLPGMSIALYCLWQQDWGALRTLNLRWGLPVFGALAVPWFVLAARADPLFLRFFFVREHIQRFLTPVEHRTQPWWFFIAVLVVGILPWFPMAVKSLMAARRKSIPAGQFDPVRVLCAWSVVIFVFFSCSDSKLVTYILPVVPALALLCSGRRTDEDTGSVYVGAALSMAAAFLFLAYGHGAWHSHKHEDLGLHMQAGLWMTAILVATGSVLCASLLRKGRHLVALGILCLGWLLGSFGLLFAGTEVEADFSAKAMAEELLQTAWPAAPIFSVQVYDQSLAFYLRRPVTLVDYRDEFAFGLDQEPERGIADLNAFLDTWRSLADGYAVMRPGTRDLLQRRGFPMREVATFPDRILVSRR
jgi:4-amino-4-deoxy-L-arabinose transferase-like glycosyltransferase